MKIAIIGAGIMGASTAYACAKRGHEVTVFDQFQPGHVKGSSHGNSRIVRKAYPDRFYTEIMQEGYPLWKGIQALTDQQILFETGLVYFGKKSSLDMELIVKALEKNGVAQEELAEHHFPQLKLRDDEYGTFTPDAGWVYASRAVMLLLELSAAKVVLEHVANPASLTSSFDRVIVCSGAWITDLVQIPVEVSAQTVAYIQVPAPFNCPVWIEDTFPMFYGFPSEPGRNVIKVGFHSLGCNANVGEPNSPDPLALEALTEAVKQRFNILSPVITDSYTCFYTKTRSEDFLWGEACPNVFWASPCSGHGFKFGPWIGERMADFAEGKMHPSDQPRFNLI